MIFVITGHYQPCWRCQRSTQTNSDFHPFGVDKWAVSITWWTSTGGAPSGECLRKKVGMEWCRMWMVATYRRTHRPSWLTWSVGLWVGADSTYTYLYNIYHPCCAVLRGSILCIIVAVIAFWHWSNKRILYLLTYLLYLLYFLPRDAMRVRS